MQKKKHCFSFCIAECEGVSWTKQKALRPQISIPRKLDRKKNDKQSPVLFVRND